ncbi:MAG: DNA mismatch repair protein MutL, partial [Draconibacterium sp.]|nr:DNA mismatch repair protein MutL [Draconibacterium sp.]
NSTELKNIIWEIQRIALPNPDIKITLFHNNSQLYQFPVTNNRKRIVDVFGKNLNHSLISVNEKTSVINIQGFIGQPKYARKTMGEQFFFVNGRYMHHPYFHKAVMMAYEQLLPPDTFPSYFLFLETDPASIDINVHPTKTEIKFENDREIWQIIHATVRQSLGKHNVVPSIDFDQSGNIDIPVPQKSTENIVFPDIPINPEYNPFNEQKPTSSGGSYSKPFPSEKRNLEHWEDLYEGAQLKLKPEEQNQSDFSQNSDLYSQSAVQFTGKKYFS